MTHRKTPRPASLLALAALLCIPGEAFAQQARITGLIDFTYGTLTLASDQTLTQNVCVYTQGSGRRYDVTASGSGAGSAFTLANGGATLAYEVQWNASANQSSGTAMTPNVALVNLRHNNVNQTCSGNTRPTATLITIVRATTASAATSGNYSGTLTLVIAPN